MLRKVLMTVVCAAAIASALPTIKITTPDGQNPPNGRQVGGSSGGMGNMAPSYDFDYVGMSRFEITGADNPRHNFVRTEPGDSVRQRGNSSAGTSHVKKPYRIKFDKKVSLFGKEAAKNWVLLANNVDATMARNATSFRIAKEIGLPYSPSFEYVLVQICNPNGTCSDKGVYMLTEQVEVGTGRVDIDKKDGWLVEINFHDPDANDIMFKTSAFNMTAFVKSPDWDNLYDSYKGSDISSYPELTFVRDQFTAVVNAMNNSSQFSSGEYRNLIDLTTYARYTLLMQFMSNPEWGGNMGNGMPGSNFAHKDADGKMSAGPAWDFDHAGSSMMGGGGSGSIETGISFYKKFFEDEVFRARYRIAWDDYKKAVEEVTRDGGLIDSIAKVLEPHIVANYNASRSGSGGGGGMGSTAATSVDDHRQKISEWKTWLNNRVNTFNTAITTGNGVSHYDASKDKPDTDKGPVIPDDDPPEQGGVRTVSCNNYTLTISLSVGGSVSFSSCDGDTVTVTPAPSSGYAFINWTGDGLSGGVTSSTVNPLKVGMTRDREISANFGQTSPIMQSDKTLARGKTPMVSVRGRTLSVSSPNNGALTVRMIDARGRTVTQYNVGATVPGRPLSLSLAKIPAGRYFVDVKGAGVRHTLPVIIK